MKGGDMLLTVIQATKTAAAGQIVAQFTTHKLGRRLGRALVGAIGVTVALNHFPGWVPTVEAVDGFIGVPGHWRYFGDAWNEWAGVAVAFLTPLWNLDGKGELVEET
jgi:hypothetical protein